MASLQNGQSALAVIADSHEERLQKVEEKLSDVKADVSALNVKVDDLGQNVERGFAELRTVLGDQKKAKTEKKSFLLTSLVVLAAGVLPLLVERFFFHAH